MAFTTLTAFRTAALKGSMPSTAHNAILAVCPPAGVRLMHMARNSGVVCMGHGSHASDNNPEIIQREKERNLTGQTGEHVPGVPGWNEKLASDSEATVKAERTDMSVEEMVEHSTKVAKEINGEGEQTERSPVDPSQAPDIKENMKRA